jgi:DeoR/GlpR family transcriptional regulator of sugar metabolism
MTIENSKLTSDVTLEHLGPSSRQKWITEYILERGSLEVDELSEQFQVSRMTIHRDLDELEKQGVLRKSRGGATVHPSYLFESDIRFRLNAATAEKEAIARFASSLVEPGQVILLDDSTTTIALAQHLKHIKPLTVITNCLHIMEIMHEEHDIRLIALGGDYLPRFMEFLFSKNRLNVALSRARCLALLVANPKLMAINCHTVEQMALVNTLCWVAEYSESG